MTATATQSHRTNPPPLGAPRRYPSPAGGAASAGRARRGSIYAVVMGLSILVALIGLTTIAVGRINLRTTTVGGEAGDAELLALSAVEHATTVVNTDSTWRTKYIHDTEVATLQLGRGSFTWKVVDDADANLSNDPAQPVRVVGLGSAGVARRSFSVLLLPTGTNLLLNPGTESGVPPWAPSDSSTGLESHSLASSGLEPRSGTYYISVKGRPDQYAGPQQDVTTSVVSGRSYYLELWVRMTNVAEDPWFVLVAQKAGYPDTVFKVRGKTASTTWTKITGTLTPSWSVTPDKVYWRLETNSSNQEFHFDDAKLIEANSGSPMAHALDTWRQEPVK